MLAALIRRGSYLKPVLKRVEAHLSQGDIAETNPERRLDGRD
jgi:hypothetical protein